MIKLGGSTLDGQTATGAPDTTLDDILKLARESWRIVLVHGGGNAINGLLKKLGQEPRFLNGLRVTDEAALGAALMIMRGQINAELVAAINRAGAPQIKAIGLSGVDGSLIECRRDTAHGDLGLVGEIVKVNTAPLELLLEVGFLPVIAPFGFSLDQNASIFNINADNVAAHLAAALQAEVCAFLTNVPGVLNAEKQLVSKLSPAQARAMLANGVISGGMIPKIEAALKAAEGAEQTLILDGRPANTLYNAIAKAQVSGTVLSAA